MGVRRGLLPPPPPPPPIPPAPMLTAATLEPRLEFDALVKALSAPPGPDRTGLMSEPPGWMSDVVSGFEPAPPPPPNILV